VSDLTINVRVWDANVPDRLAAEREIREADVVGSCRTWASRIYETPREVTELRLAGGELVVVLDRRPLWAVARRVETLLSLRRLAAASRSKQTTNESGEPHAV